MAATESFEFALAHPSEPRRIVRGCIEGPRGYRFGAPRPHVLVLHGFKGFMGWGFFPLLSRRIAERGLVAVRYNASGSGIGADGESFTEHEAFAHNTYTRELEDLDIVRAELRAGRWPGIDASRAGALGHSRGGAVVLLDAARHGGYRALVTWAAIAYVDRFDDATKARWREQGTITVRNARTGLDHELALDLLRDVEERAAELDLAAACARIRAPVLLVHGSEDESVSCAEAGLLAASLGRERARVLELEGAGHTFGATHPLREPVPAPLERAIDASLEHLCAHLL